jgi:hypothetical protein
MNTNLYKASWNNEEPSKLLLEASEILKDNVWRETAINFYATRAAKLRNNKPAPKGMQAELNKVITSRFEKAGWVGIDGRFIKDQVWIRITFRHQMSLGSDILEALKVFSKEKYKQVAIFACSLNTLKIISPNDAGALVSFEKLRIAIADLHGVLNIPLFIGELTQFSELPKDIEKEIYRPRPRG